MGRLETERLLLRPPTLRDVPALFEFLGDPQAMQHTHLDTSLRQCRRRIAVHERRRRRDGYAPWTVRTKQDRSIIGWGGIYEDPFDPGWGVEVGYAFHPRVWGRGYATELAQFCVDLADRALMLPELNAFAKADNTASRRVLEKTGFEELGFEPALGRLHYRRARG
ncbi:GNAT family N-acetyltransferase [Pelagibius litoralis]|uniref:GNAT family N-acetyltransferase n=1 Tax=Pelagibius litoralis TaxID=374515 RepID=A0A967C432_9PROT|nr:GNAT family N-acetyltransferase [Pelagibius litoralis]NIA68275.1 GNAT family N-acetyltransferase [Pelagibius litoralis]